MGLIRHMRWPIVILGVAAVALAMILVLRPSGPLYVKRVVLPGAYFTYVGEVPDFIVEYNQEKTPLPLLEVQFSVPIQISEEAVLPALQNGQNLTVRSHTYRDADGRPAPLVFVVQGNRLQIRPTHGVLPQGLLWLRLDGQVRDRSGQPIQEVVDLRLASDFPSTARLLARAPGSWVPILAESGNPNPVGYVEEVTDIHSDAGGGAAVGRLQAYDTFYILREEDGKTRIAALKLVNPPRRIRETRPMEALRSCTSAVEGYVPSSQVHRLPAPKTPGALSMILAGPTLRVFLPPNAYQLETLREPVTELAVQRLEAVALLQWREWVGSEFAAETYEGDRRIPILSQEHGRLMRNMDQAAFERYETLYADYANGLAEKWDAVWVPDELRDLKRDLKDRYFVRFLDIHEAWLSWVRIDRSESAAAFISRLERVVDPQDAPRVVEVFSKTIRDPRDEVYLPEMSNFLSVYVSVDEWNRRVSRLRD